MNNEININTVALSEKIQLLKQKNKMMTEVFDSMKRKIETIPNYWNSNTSDLTMADFRNLYSEFESILSSNKKYIAFLESIITKDYENADSSINLAVDSNI